MKRLAFTLIELLVVVTIIVVLLALLTPALDRAIYQAELTACGARLHGLGFGVLSYAMDHNRQYPTPSAGIARWHICLTTWGWDMRQPLKGYVSVNKHLTDPLAGKIDIEDSKEDASRPLIGTFSNYSIFWDWRYTALGPEK